MSLPFPWRTDLDHDGRDDAVVILVNEPGGSGSFYYVAAAYNDGTQFVGSTALLLGDRIDIQSVAVSDGIVIVSYSDRPQPGAPLNVSAKSNIWRCSGEQRRLRQL
jgi:hypothetical protein